MKKIFFCRNTNASWAIRDRDILSREHMVYDFFASSPKSYMKSSWFFQLIKSEVIFCWFASFAFYPAVLLGKALGKKIIIVSGGFDAAAEHRLGYGAFCKGWLSKKIRRSLFGLADKVLCVSKANMLETIINAKVASDRCQLIYHGFEPLPSGYRLKSWNERKDQVVLISQCDHSTFYRKGVDQFIKLAQSLPDFEFLLVGRVHDDFQKFIKDQATSNLKCLGFMPFRGEEFNETLNESKFILQLSMYESFGCSVIDGSIMGCFPITTNEFSLFEVAEGVGKSFPHGDLPSIKQEILIQSQSSVDASEISRISLEKFPFDARMRGILDSVDFI